MLLARRDLDAVRREKGRLRSYLLASLKNFLAKAHRREMAVKRGEGRPLVALEELLARERVTKLLDPGSSWPSFIHYRDDGPVVYGLLSPGLGVKVDAHHSDRVIDPEAARACARAGVGVEVALAAGGKVDRNAPPLMIKGKVRALHDGRYVEEEPRHGGIRINDQGLTAVVELAGENILVLNSLRHPPFSLRQLTSLDLCPESARVIVVKAAVAYKAAYGPIAGRVIEVDTPGLTAIDPTRFDFRHIRRPMFPLDD